MCILLISVLIRCQFDERESFQYASINRTKKKEKCKKLHRYPLVALWFIVIPKKQTKKQNKNHPNFLCMCVCVCVCVYKDNKRKSILYGCLIDVVVQSNFNLYTGHLLYCKTHTYQHHPKKEEIFSHITKTHTHIYIEIYLKGSLEPILCDLYNISLIVYWIYSTQHNTKTRQG